MRKDIKNAITKTTNKHILHLNHLNIDDKDVAGIVALIQKTRPELHILNLDDNHISDAGAKILGEGLRPLHHLKELSIQYNTIAAPGALDLFRLKKELPHLMILFRGNNITNVAEMVQIEQEAWGYSPSL